MTRFVSISRGAPLVLSAALLTTLGLGAVSSSAFAAPDEGYDFQVTIAPIAMTGDFPVTVQADGGPVAGTLSCGTAANGKVTGTLTLDGREFKVKGKVRFTPTGHSIKLNASDGKKHRLTLNGDLVNDEFTGSAKNKGNAAAGATTFSLDVSGAQPLVARIKTVVTEKRGRLKGGGILDVDGVQTKLRNSGVNKKNYKITFKSGKFRFTGTGTHVAGSAVLTWTARGFGATTSPDVINIDTIVAPQGITYTASDVMYETEMTIAPNVPTLPGDPADGFLIDPPLPAGLSMDPDTGVITGEPIAEVGKTRHTVTASNLAGTGTARLDIGVRKNRMYSLDAQKNLTDDDLRHFLIRTHFGVRPDELAELKNKGLPTYLQQKMNFQLDTPWEQQAVIDELQDNNDPDALFPNTTEIARWWAAIMMDTENPLQESIAFFSHDHFAVSSDVLGGGRVHQMVNYVNLFRGEGVGNLRDLLVDVSRDEAMLRYLDGYQNRDGRPNENYAREFWELFSLGADNGYTQDDIVEAARAFTGWRERSETFPYEGEDVTRYYMEFDPSRHDGSSKSFFGQTVAAQDITDDFDAVADITLANRDVAEFFVHKMIEWYAFEDPPQELVDALAAELRNGNWELAPVYEKLFRSEAFYSDRARGSFVKSPVDFAIGFVRSTGLRVRPSDLDSSLNTLGQRPTQPPVVDGWPAGLSWLSAQSMVDRTNLAHTVINDINRQEGLGLNVATLLPPVGERATSQIVDHVADTLGVTLDATERADLINYLETERQSNGSIVAKPFNPDDQDDLDTRLRGLLHILAQHPTYHLR